MTNVVLPAGCLVLAVLCTGLVACRPAAEPVHHTGNTTNDTTDNNATDAAMTTEEKNAIAGLQWLNAADPAQDAVNELKQAAAQSRQPALLAFAGRGISYPGLSKEQLAAIDDKTTYKFAEGSGDVIYGPVHHEMRRKLRAYTVAYNQAIFAGVQ